MAVSCSVVEPQWLARSAPEVAPELIGCSLVRQFSDGTLRRGIIVEVEAYGPEDPACHGYRKRTPRNAAMFGPAGYSYVYLIYGMYHCLNIVTDAVDVPSAVLLRALDIREDPPTGDASALAQKTQRLAAGPGKLCQYLQIDRSFDQKPLQPGQSLWLERRSPTWEKTLQDQSQAIIQTTRIGLSKGAEIPWRWYLKGNIAVSKR